MALSLTSPLPESAMQCTEFSGRGNACGESSCGRNRGEGEPPAPIATTARELRTLLSLDRGAIQAVDASPLNVGINRWFFSRDREG